jgi:hypothetical protein
VCSSAFECPSELLRTRGGRKEIRRGVEERHWLALVEDALGDQPVVIGPSQDRVCPKG